jgi:hypothetical protein
MPIQFTDTELELIRQALFIASDKLITEAFNEDQQHIRTGLILKATHMKALYHRVR